MKSNRILPCGVSSAGEDRLAGAGAADVGRHQIVEEFLGVRPADRHHAAALEDRYLTVAHGKCSCCLTESPTGAGIQPVSTVAALALRRAA